MIGTRTYTQCCFLCATSMPPQRIQLLSFVSSDGSNGELANVGFTLQGSPQHCLGLVQPSACPGSGCGCNAIMRGKRDVEVHHRLQAACCKCLPSSAAPASASGPLPTATFIPISVSGPGPITRHDTNHRPSTEQHERHLVLLIRKYYKFCSMGLVPVEAACRNIRTVPPLSIDQSL